MLDRILICLSIVLLIHCTKNEVFQETADLVTFTEEILNGKLHFLCSDNASSSNRFPSFLPIFTKEPKIVELVSICLIIGNVRVVIFAYQTLEKIPTGSMDILTTIIF